MFTGIVQEKGKIERFDETSDGARIAISAPHVSGDAEIGDSIAVDGCCLTVVGIDTGTLEFDLLAETIRVTTFQKRRTGDFVNLEDSLRFNGKIGGHFVTGHIDGAGVTEVMERRGQDYYLRIRIDPSCAHYLIHKGSVAINGVSLTIAEAGDDSFSVWLIPHTLEVTNLSALSAGDPVNLEFDLLGKYVERLMEKKATE